MLKPGIFKTAKSLRKMSHLGEWEKPAYYRIIEAESDAYETQILKG